MKKLLILGYLSLCFRLASAGNDPAQLGARAAALGNASVCISDVWSVGNNVSGIAGLQKPEVGVFADNRFGIKAFTSVALVGVRGLGKSGGIGVELYRFGDKMYNEQRIGVGYAHKISKVSLGVKADLMQVHIEGLGSKRVVAFSVGGQSEVVPGLVVGAHVFNLNQAQLAVFEDERVPTVMTAGISYRPGKKIMLNAETEKDLELPAGFKAGLEYKPLSKLAIRTGFSTLTETIALGLGFDARALQVDYTFASHSQLGFNNHISLSYKFE